jgi:hypothetical protein
LKIYNILEECILFSKETMLPMFKGQIDELLNMDIDLSQIHTVSLPLIVQFLLSLATGEHP